MKEIDLMGVEEIGEIIQKMQREKRQRLSSHLERTLDQCL